MAALDDAVPENTLLSHDLFEGLHARRQHRWVPSDWQILSWLFPIVRSRHGLKRNTLPAIARWKIFDNLRRSLTAPLLLLLLVAGWTVLPGAHSNAASIALAETVAEGAGVLARDGPAVRGRHPQRTRGGLPR